MSVVGLLFLYIISLLLYYYLYYTYMSKRYSSLKNIWYFGLNPNFSHFANIFFFQKRSWLKTKGKKDLYIFLNMFFVSLKIKASNCVLFLQEEQNIPSIDNSPPGEVPAIVMSCIKHLENYGLHTTGIFRVSTSLKRIRQV